jgi:hypothetical protein
MVTRACWHCAIHPQYPSRMALGARTRLRSAGAAFCLVALTGRKDGVGNGIAAPSICRAVLPPQVNCGQASAGLGAMVGEYQRPAVGLTCHTYQGRCI